MAVYPSAGALADRYRIRRTALTKEMAPAQRQSAKEIRLLAVQVSSGPYSSAALQRMGHPYATRKPNPPINPAIINAQSGAFRAAWRIEVRTTKSGAVIVLSNTSDVARFLLLGTSLMIARPFLRAIFMTARGPHFRRLAAAKSRALIR